jgi:hypothetical protein
MANHPARVCALAICLGVLIGGSLPELGNITVYYMSENAIAFNRDAHAFNGLFLILGICGILGCGFALYRRLACLNSSASRMVRIIKDQREKKCPKTSLVLLKKTGKH